MAGSPITYLTEAMTAEQTTATVSDGTALPEAPNLCTIGFGSEMETIRYGVKVGNSLSDITRGIEGVPQAWDVGTEVARFFTAYDHNELVAEITRLEQERVTHLAESVAHVIESSGKHVHSSGSNWIKYDCGIAECWGTFQVTGRIDQPWENLFYLRVDPTPYPQEVEFISRPHCVFINLGSRAWFHTQVGGTASSTPTLDIYRPIADSVDQTYSIGYRAIGRWK